MVKRIVRINNPRVDEIASEASPRSDHHHAFATATDSGDQGEASDIDLPSHIWCKDRDRVERVFDQFVKERSKALVAEAIKILKNESDAKDAAQQAMINAFKYLRNFDPKHCPIPTKDRKEGEAFFGWVKGILRNVIIEMLNKRKRLGQWQSSFISDDDDDYDPTANLSDDKALSPESEVLIAEALTVLREKVSEGTWQAFKLHCLEELPYEEAAAALGLSVVAIKVRVHRARLALRKIMGRPWPPQQNTKQNKPSDNRDDSEEQGKEQEPYDSRF